MRREMEEDFVTLKVQQKKKSQAAALSPFVFPPPTYPCLEFWNWEEGVNSAKAGSKTLQGSGGCAAAAALPPMPEGRAWKCCE